jgi:hypothetical protein
MKTKKAAAVKTPAPREKLKTRPYSLRISERHLDELHALEVADGVQKTAQIQRAIAEYIERRRAES